MAKIPLWRIKDIAEVIDGWINSKYDAVVLIEGCTGSGKSTLMYKIANRLKSPIPPFSPERDLLYKREDVLYAIANRQHGIICGDELINVAYKRDFYEQMQKDLIKYINMYRDNFNVLIGCVPYFIDLDKDLQKLCRMRISVVERGVALIHIKVPSLYSNDCWDVKNNLREESKWKARGIVKPRYSRLTTVVGYLHFNKLEDSSEALYTRIKREKRHKAVGMDLPQTNSEQEFIDRLCGRIVKKELTPKMFNEICMVAGKQYASVRGKVNAYLKTKGDTLTFRDYVSKDNIGTVKRDTLGFINN